MNFTAISEIIGPASSFQYVIHNLTIILICCLVLTALFYYMKTTTERELAANFLDLRRRNFLKKKALPLWQGFLQGSFILDIVIAALLLVMLISSKLAYGAFISPF